MSSRAPGAAGQTAGYTPRMRAKQGEELVESLPTKLDKGHPKGEQLQEILESFITTLEPGMVLPSERTLEKRYKVARATVTQAINELVSKGLLYRVRGSGTFVAEPKLRQPATLSSFSEDMRARGMQPGSVVLDHEVIPAGVIIARQLELEPNAPVLHLHRLRTADGEPMALERVYLPAERFPGLEVADLTDTSLYDVLAERWGAEVAVADQWVMAIRLSDREARLLEVPAGQPALLCQRVTRDVAGVVVEYSRALYRGDRYETHTRLRRPGAAPETP